jgi:hypothetical protein
MIRDGYRRLLRLDRTVTGVELSGEISSVTGEYDASGANRRQNACFW